MMSVMRWSRALHPPETPLGSGKDREERTALWDARQGAPACPLERAAPSGHYSGVWLAHTAVTTCAAIPDCVESQNDNNRNHNGKEHEKTHTYITESLCCIPETKTTLEINYTSVK